MVIKKRSNSIIFSMLLAFMLSLVSLGSQVFAAVSEEQAMKNLTTYVYGKMSQSEYTLAEGGSIRGADLFTGKPTEGYELNEKEFTKLSAKAQSQVVSDIAKYSNEAVDSDTVRGVEESTVQTWWKTLQTKDGVGSKFMGEILKNTKPDFVTANKIYEPFSGVVGTLLGLGAVLIMTFLGLVIVCDIAYIVLPPFRLVVGDSGGKSARFISHDAIHAVRKAEGAEANKQALGIYFKKRIFALILLGICLLYLVQGQIYTLVGYILDLVSGFLGF